MGVCGKNLCGFFLHDFNQPAAAAHFCRRQKWESSKMKSPSCRMGHIQGSRQDPAQRSWWEGEEEVRSAHEKSPKAFFIALGLFLNLERATRLELASRHPANGLRPFAGALPDLGLKTRFARTGGGSEFFPPNGKNKTSKSDVLFHSGAGNEARTRYLHLGKVALYQMSYARGTRCILTDESHLVKRFPQFSLFSFSPVSAAPSSRASSGWSASSGSSGWAAA